MPDDEEIPPPPHAASARALTPINRPVCCFLNNTSFCGSYFPVSPNFKLLSKLMFHSEDNTIPIPHISKVHHCALALSSENTRPIVIKFYLNEKHFFFHWFLVR